MIGTERHESRRVDNQLRGRSGRQGDPGSSRFYLSLEDNLMRIFASDQLIHLSSQGFVILAAIEHNWVNKAISNAQKKVEGHNFDIRKQLIEFDNIANEQRKYIYNKRNEFLDIKDREEIINNLSDTPINLIESNINFSILLYIDDILQRDFNIKIDTNSIVKNSLKKEEVTKNFLKNIIMQSLVHNIYQ